MRVDVAVLEQPHDRPLKLLLVAVWNCASSSSCSAVSLAI